MHTKFTEIVVNDPDGSLTKTLLENNVKWRSKLCRKLLKLG
jgi:hypothetical protein